MTRRATAPTGGLCGHPAFVKGIAHDLVPQHAAIVGVPRQGEVGFAGLGLDQLLFSQLDGFENRRLAMGILINAHG